MFDGNWFKDGQLVVTIANSDITNRNKRSEVDVRTYERAGPIIVTDWESVLGSDQREILDPLAEGVIREEQIHELKDIVAGKTRLKQPPRGAVADKIIYYKNNAGIAIPRREGSDAMTRTFTAIALATALVVSAGSSAAADGVADFYKGKVVTIVIGYAAGGFDLYARLLGRFLGSHILAHPTIIAQNKPGAGSRAAANWLYNIAPRDGTVIATLSRTTPADQALGQPDIQFDARRFNWIGNIVVVNNILFANASTGVSTLAAATKKSLVIGATGASSPSILYPQVSNNLLGTKFKIISGHPGSADVNLAMERNEVDGHGSNSWASVKSERPDWVSNHVVNVLFQVGLKREPDLPDVPNPIP